ncbi:hypothetical protein R70723_32115 [Paenibacillus sp. FSL R7-0273]|uniref:DUF5696 domain-containing protein n=1 Tax=Paenibacillus sp. FSL R7-0273 TaxID=1536772 RepID=UPI0004F5E7C7|nr:DUF5696 domain-containing protein [Paenibacillus sp. FSL R7-0273]AIQ50010.1 hypothetical protein R70723_32115 [Paenibacillus sp. FSL R7-0273]OMF90879.1 hypothetical protein BK144_16560 [Paenibacillus sp. FSL R7-0273]
MRINKKLRGILVILLVLVTAAVGIRPLQGSASQASGGSAVQPAAAGSSAEAEAAVPALTEAPAEAPEAAAEAPAASTAEPELLPVAPGTKALENDRYTLYVNEQTGNIRITDKVTGAEWLGAPQLEKTAMPNNIKYTAAPVYARYTQGADITQIYPLKDEDSSVKVTLEQDVVRAEFAFASLQLGFALEYRLTEDGFEATIPREYLKEAGSAKFTSLEVLPFFHAAGEKAEGAMMLPDGSGALLEFRPDHPTYLKGYSEYIYGGDETFITQNHEITDSYWQKAAPLKKNIALPVFGMYHGGTGYLAIVTEGDTDAKINGVPSGIRAIPLYRASCEFTLRKDDVIFVGSSGQIPYYQGKLIDSGRAVRYVLLQGDNADYVGMAKEYRQYLLNSQQIQESAPAAVPLYLEVLGGISRDEIIGSTFVEMTTFRQVQEIIDRYQAEGVSELEITVTGWSKNGLLGNQPDHFPADKHLGGSKGLEELQAYVAEKGVRLYLKSNYVKPYQDSSAVKAGKEAVRGINREVLKQYIYYLSSGWNTDDHFYLLKPDVIAGRASSELDSYRKLGVAGVAFEHFGSLLYSDEDNSSLSDRRQTEEVYTGTLEQYRKEGLRTAVDYGYAYALESADRIDQVPLDYSGFVYTDRAIPFYQLVVHGLIPYTSAPVNLFDDSRKQLLRALEYGALPSYKLTYAATSDLQRTLENGLFTSSVDDWLKPSAQTYLDMKELFGRVAGRQMTGHEQLEAQVFKTTYEGGVSIITNYNDYAVNAGGQQVAAYGYAVTGG